MKLPCKVEDLPEEKVASFAEAWIEIKKEYLPNWFRDVASFAEAWIEILRSFATSSDSSRLLRGGVD